MGSLDFSSKVLYLLAAPSIPEEARQEALALAESGKKITHAEAQELVAKYKAELALKYEARLKEKAKENQLASLKQNNTVPQNSAERKPIDTREELAKAAGVSHDTIHKVKIIQEQGRGQKGLPNLANLNSINTMIINGRNWL